MQRREEQDVRELLCTLVGQLPYLMFVNYNGVLTVECSYTLILGVWILTPQGQ